VAVAEPPGRAERAAIGSGYCQGRVRESIRDKFHEDFVTDVDLQWLLGGWKGRILYAMSTWAAADAILDS